jgi:hypothetical protein
MSGRKLTNWEKRQRKWRMDTKREREEHRERLVRKDVEKRIAWEQVCAFMLRGQRPPPECLAPSREQVKAKMLEIALTESVYSLWYKDHLSKTIGVSEEEIEAATLELWAEGKINNPPR